MSTNEQPFFARYLEGQDFPSVKTNVKAGLGGFPREPVTLKYPSDGDEPTGDGPPRDPFNQEP